MNQTADIAALEAREWFSGKGDTVAAAPAATAGVTRVFDIADLIGLLQRGRRTILLTVAATTFAALAFGLLASKYYEAETQLLVDSRGYQVLPNEVAQRNSNSQSLMADFETELQVLGSGSVLGRVVETEKLASNRAFVRRPGYSTRLKALVFGSAIPSEPPDITATKILSQMVSIKRSDRSFVAGVRIRSHDPQLSARLAHAVANAYLEIQARNRQDLTRRLATEVAGRLQDLRERVEAAEKRLATYNRKHNLVTANGTLVSDQDLTELNRQLNEARTRTARAKAQLDQMKRLPRTIGVVAQSQGTLNSPTLVQLTVRLADANRQLAELRRNLGPRHPDIRAAEARAGEMRIAIANEVARQRKAMEVEYAQAREHERNFERNIAQLKSRNTDISEVLIGARELQRAVEANKKVYEEFLVRARELTEQQSIAPTSSRIITQATPPTTPSNVPLSYLLLAGLLAGLPLGVGIAFLRDLLNGKAVSAPDGLVLSNQHAAPVADGSSSSVLRTRLDRAELDAFIVRSYLRTVSIPPDSMLDSVRALLKATGAPDKAVFLVTNSSQGNVESSSAFAITLAATLAYQGHDTLLADGDSVRQQTSKALSSQFHPGLFDRFHRDVMQLVLWNRTGLPHILASMPPGKRKMPQGAHRYLAQRLEELAENLEMLVIDTGYLADNPFSSTLMEAATHVIVVGNTGSETSGIVDFTQRHGGSVAALVEMENAPVTISDDATKPSRHSFLSAMMGAKANRENNGNKKRWYFGR